MIDRVELAVFDQLYQMRKFKGRDPVRLEQVGETRHEVVDIGHMSQDIVGNGQIGRTIRGCQAPRQRHTEELLDDLDAPAARGSRRACGGLDSEAGNATLAHVLQQVTIICGHLNDMRCGLESKRRIMSST